MSDLTNLFPQWGDDGVLPSNGFFYSGGDQVTADNFNALWNGVQEQNSQLIDGVRDRIRDAVGDVVLNGGLVVSQGTNARDVDVSASDGAYVDGQKVGAVSATTLTLSAGGPRTDSVYLTTTGVLGLTEGTTTVADTRMKVAEVDLSAADEVTDVRNTANDLQFDYVTETEPSGASAGDTWLDLSTNRVKVYQNGGFRTLITEQDSITVNGGDGLSGGGPINLLGGSTSLDVNVSDFAGEHLSDDGSNNLSVDDDFVSNSGDTVNGSLDVTGTLSESSNQVLTTADEGSGNGLDADTVDGFDAEDLSSPITETEKVSTFNESYVSTSLNGTFLYSGSVRLISGFDVDNSSLQTSQSVVDGSRGLAWNNDGTKLYYLNTRANEIIERDVSTPFDISTLGSSTSISSSGFDSDEVMWNDDGTKLYELDSSGSDISEYDVTTPFDITTATLTDTFDVYQGGSPEGMAWGKSGEKLYTTDDSNVYEYNVSTPFDVTTASYFQTFTTSASNIGAMEWDNLGSRFFVTDTDGETIYQYTVSNLYDISTVKRVKSRSTQSGSTVGLAWNNDGSNLYTISDGSDSIYQYSVTSNVSGNVVAEFDRQSDIVSWDIATQQKTLDGETVTVDIEDENGNVLLSDIGRNVDISSIPSSTNIRFRATLQRSNTDNNPTLDFLARRYEQ